MVIFVTPPKLDKLSLNSDNWNNKFELEWIYEKINELNSRNLNNPQLLIVIDDFID